MTTSIVDTNPITSITCEWTHLTEFAIVTGEFSAPSDDDEGLTTG